MALQTRDALLNVGYLLSAGVSDVQNFYSFTSPDKPTLGAVAYLTSFGHFNVYRAGRILQANGMTQGELTERAALVADSITAISGETNDLTHAAATNIFTADNEEGKIFQVNVAGAAAPEGETAFIVDNTASQLTFDRNFPLSTAVASADTFSDWGINHWIDGTADTNAIDVGGIVMSDPATTGDICWLQILGYHPNVEIDATAGAMTQGAAGVSGASANVGVRNAQTEEDFIGYFPQTTSTTAVVGGFVIDLWSRTQAIAS